MFTFFTSFNFIHAGDHQEYSGSMSESESGPGVTPDDTYSAPPTLVSSATLTRSLHIICGAKCSLYSDGHISSKTSYELRTSGEEDADLRLIENKRAYLNSELDIAQTLGLMEATYNSLKMRKPIPDPDRHFINFAILLRAELNRIAKSGALGEDSE